MYKIYANNELLYDPEFSDQGYAVSAPELTLELNQPGTLTFSVPPDNPLYNSLATRSTYIRVVDDQTEIFYGRIIDTQKNFDLTITVQAEGALAFFADSICRPYGYSGSVAGYFAQLIETHNAQVDEARRVQIGQVTVADPNDYIVRSSETPMTTLAALSDGLLDKLGGIIQIKRSIGGRYISYLADASTNIYQPVEFGKNLLDLTRTVDSAGVITCLIPYGARLEQTDGESSEPPANGTYDGGRVGISGVNNGKDYVEDEEAVKRYGRIWGTNTWDDVTDPANLLRKAREYLVQQISDADSISATVVDLHQLNPTTPRIKLGEYVYTSSPAHGVGKKLLCTAQKLYLNAPGNDEITLGATWQSMTSRSTAPDTAFIETDSAVSANKPLYVNGVPVLYQAGDVVTIYDNGDSFSGFVTGSTKNLVFTIPLSRPVAAKKAAISGRVIGRGVNGYINGNYVADSTAISLSGGSGYSVATKISPGGIRVFVTFDAEIVNAINNTPVNLTPYSLLTISFS